jgi:hypothetical protein
VVNYTPQHPYEKADDGDYCGAPDAASSTKTCVREPDHPVHALDRPDVEALARALASRRWRTTPDSLAPESEHRRHRYSYECALCTQDVHAIAAAVLEILGADR